MRKQLFWILALTSFGYGQQKQPVSSLQEDCGVTFNFSSASSGAQAAGTTTAGSIGTTAVIDNRQAGCLDWLVTYAPNTAVASVSLAFQIATDVLGVPTTWSNYPGTLNSGINPNTAITAGGAVTDATGPKYPFLRMNMTVLTGAGGTISGKLYGWKRRPTYVVISSGGGCVGTIATPCVVVGPGADGAAIVGSPVRVAGSDGTNTRTILTDSSGRQTVIGSKTNNAAAPGATNVGVLPCIANAAAPTWTEAFEVLCSVDLAGNQRITGTVAVSGTVIAAGNKTNNAAVPGATNVGALICLANAAAPTWTEAFEVLCSVDLSGNQRVSPFGVATAQADGASNTPTLPTALGVASTVREYPFAFNGSTWDRQFACTNQTAVITLTDATRTVLVAASGSTNIRICHIHFTTSGAAEEVTLSSGTGSACGTGTAVIDDYLNTTALVMDFQPTAALRGGASNAICVTQSGGAQTAKVFAIYAQF